MRRPQSFFGTNTRKAAQKKSGGVIEVHTIDTKGKHRKGREDLEHLGDRDLFFFDPPLSSARFPGRTTTWYG